MANTANGFVVVSIGDKDFTLTPTDVSPAKVKDSLRNLQVSFVAATPDEEVEIGQLSDLGGLLAKAFTLGNDAVSGKGIDPSGELKSAFDTLKGAFDKIGSSADFTALKNAIDSITVSLTQITIDLPNNHFTFGIALDCSQIWPTALPVKLKRLAITIDHQKPKP